MLPWLIGIVVVLALIAFSPMRKKGRNGLKNDTDWRPAQIVGQACLDCEGIIRTEGEVKWCKSCGGPLHRKDCAARHKALAHPLDPGSAYR